MYDGVQKIGNPIDYANDYVENSIDELMLINNTGTLYNTKLDLNLLKEIRKNKALPISAGGGIKNYDDAINLIDSGCDKVVINSLIHTNPNEVLKIVDSLGSSSVTGAIQFEKRKDNYVTFYEMARESTGLNLIETIKKYKDLGIGELLLTDINRDGLQTGLNTEIYDILSDFKKDFPIILGGGFSNYDEIENFKEYLSGISISSAFHLKKLKVSETIKYRDKVI